MDRLSCVFREQRCLSRPARRMATAGRGFPLPMNLNSFTALLSGLTFVSSIHAGDIALENWPSFRGPLSTGVAPRANPPVHWSESSNVLWKVPVPGAGNASPVVWGD